MAIFLLLELLINKAHFLKEKDNAFFSMVAKMAKHKCLVTVGGVYK